MISMQLLARRALSCVLIVAAQWSSAGPEICAENNGGYACIKSDLWFQTYRDSTRYSNGSAACAVFNFEGAQRRQTDGTWYAKHPQWGPTCMYNFCEFFSAIGETAPSWHCQPISGQGWVFPNQSCPVRPTGNWTAGWMDTADNGEDARGRQWCGYKELVDDQSCAVGNPVLPGSGVKLHTEIDYIGAGASPLLAQRFYRSQWVDGIPQGLAISRDFGAGWKFSFHAQLSKILPEPRWGQVIHAFRPDGGVQAFYSSRDSAPGQRVWYSNTTRDMLTEVVASGATAGWTIKNFSTDEEESYDHKGQLKSVRSRAGWITTLAHDAAGNVVELASPFGRKFRITYDLRGRVSTLIGPGGATTTYGYDATDNLVAVTWADGSSRYYEYNDLRFPNALTGVVNEVGVRIGSYAYDNLGRVVSTERANGTDRITLGYAVDGYGKPSSQISTPAGYVILGFEDVGAIRRLVTSTAPNAYCGSLSLKSAYRGDGQEPLRVVSHDGTITFHSYDAKWREIEKAVFSSSYNAEIVRPPLQVAQRVVTTKWHQSWKLPLQIAEAGRIVGYSYDAKGNLTGQSWVATTDATGQQGFGAAKVGPTYAAGWSYNSKGLVSTVIERQTPFGAGAAIETGRWSLSYNASGDVTTIKDVRRNLVATATTYDAHGRMLAGVTDAGDAINFTYSPRGFYSSKSINGQRVVFTQDPTGLTTSASTPDGQSILYVYDASRRLVDVKVNGASVTVAALTTGSHPDTRAAASVAQITSLFRGFLESLFPVAVAQVAQVPGAAAILIAPGQPMPGQPQFDPRTDMLSIAPMGSGDVNRRTLLEQVTRMCQCDPAGGYGSPKLTAAAYTHMLIGGHLSPLFSNQSYFTSAVSQRLVDEVVGKTVALGPTGGAVQVYEADLGYPVGFARTVSGVFAPTSRVRLVVNMNNCNGLLRVRNEVITMYPVS
jgi:YD repeat-containing protein